MAIATDRGIPLRLFWLDPNILLRVKDSERRVILFAVVASKDPQLALVKCCSVVLDLRGTAYDWTKHGL